MPQEHKPPYHGWTKEQLVDHWHKTVQTLRNLGDAMQRAGATAGPTPLVNDTTKPKLVSGVGGFSRPAGPTPAEVNEKEAAWGKELDAELNAGKGQPAGPVTNQQAAGAKPAKPKKIDAPAQPAGPDVVQQSSTQQTDEDDE